MPRNKQEKRRGSYVRLQTVAKPKNINFRKEKKSKSKLTNASQRGLCRILNDDGCLLLMQFPSQLPDLGIHSCRESNLGFLPCFRSFSCPHALIFDIFLVILDFLDDMVIHWIEASLEGYVTKVREITSNCY